MVLCGCERTTAHFSVQQNSWFPACLYWSRPKSLIQQLGKQHGFAVDTTEDATKFNEENLKRYQAVVFLNTTGDVLNAEQQNAFERYIQAGGGYLGIHAAADTEYGWPWYNKLAGAWFESHPNPDNVQKGTFVVVDKTHPATSFLPEKWERDR